MFLGDGTDETPPLINDCAGYLLRTKPFGVDEGTTYTSPLIHCYRHIDILPVIHTYDCAGYLLRTKPFGVDEGTHLGHLLWCGKYGFLKGWRESLAAILAFFTNTLIIGSHNLSFL